VCARAGVNFYFILRNSYFILHNFWKNKRCCISRNIIFCSKRLLRTIGFFLHHPRVCIEKFCWAEYFLPESSASRKPVSIVSSLFSGMGEYVGHGVEGYRRWIEERTRKREREKIGAVWKGCTGVPEGGGAGGNVAYWSSGSRVETNTTFGPPGIHVVGLRTYYQTCACVICMSRCLCSHELAYVVYTECFA
jgi:hypothetical protein